MFTKRVKRGAAALAASVLLIAGGTAAQAIVTPGNFHDDEADGYFGWHQGDEHGQNSFDFYWDGIRFGSPNKAQIINGLVDTGERGTQITADELVQKVANSSVTDPYGEVYFQVALYYVTDVGSDAHDWTTLRNVAPITNFDGTVGLDVTADWTGSGGVVGALDPAPLADLLADLDAEAYEVVGYGVFAQTSSAVSAITFDGETSEFGFRAPFSYAPSGDPAVGSASDFTSIDGTVVADVCEGLAFGTGELRYDVQPIKIEGETAEQRWRMMTGIAGSLDGEYIPNEDDPVDIYGAIHMRAEFGDGDSASITISPIPTSPEDEVRFVEVDGDGKVWENLGHLGDVLDEYAYFEEYDVYVEGFSLFNEGGEVILKDLQFYDNVNLMFPDTCETDDSGSKKDDEEPAKGVPGKQPTFTG